MNNNDIVELSKVLGITTENYRLDTNNDYLLFQFLGAFMDMVEFKDKLCITDDARNLLLYSGFTEAMGKGTDQKELTKCCLWLFIGYTLSVLFLGFLEVKDDNLMSVVPKEMIDIMDIAKGKIRKKFDFYSKTLKHLLDCLDEEHSEIFNNEKRRMFSRDLFNAQTLNIGSAIPDHIKNTAVEIK